MIKVKEPSKMRNQSTSPSSSELKKNSKRRAPNTIGTPIMTSPKNFSLSRPYTRLWS
jgi:hypothetical protein